MKDQIYDKNGRLIVRTDIYHMYFYGRFAGGIGNQGRAYDANDYFPFYQALKNDTQFQDEYIAKFMEVLNEKYK